MARSKMEPSDVPRSHPRPESRLAPRPHCHGPGILFQVDDEFGFLPAYELDDADVDILVEYDRTTAAGRFTEPTFSLPNPNSGAPSSTGSWQSQAGRRNGVAVLRIAAALRVRSTLPALPWRTR